MGKRSEEVKRFPLPLNFSHIMAQIKNGNICQHTGKREQGAHPWKVNCQSAAVNLGSP